MKKLRLKLSVGRPERLLNSYTADGNPSITITLLRFEVTGTSASYALQIGNETVEGVHGDRHNIDTWHYSWITMASPIVLNIGDGKFRPDFIVKIPNSITRE